MKFKSIEKEIEQRIDAYIEKECFPKKPEEMQLCYRTTDDRIKAIITTLRKHGVNLTDFIFTALEEWEFILNRMVDKLPAYIQENLNGYEIKEEIGE